MIIKFDTELQDNSGDIGILTGMNCSSILVYIDANGVQIMVMIMILRFHRDSHVHFDCGFGSDFEV